MQISYVVVVAVVVSLVLAQVNQRLASPLLSIVDRWIRWLVFAFGGAEILRDFGWLDRPYPVLVVCCFILWFVGETLYNWLAISALSVSPFPLFPRYVANQGGEGWPVQPRLLKIRDWLRSQDFQQIQALKAEIGGGIYLRVSVYQNVDATLRIQITFLPQANGVPSACFSITTLGEGDIRVVTDNLYIPFGGFYPESWLVERSPWIRALPNLLTTHIKRLDRLHVRPVPFTVDPLADLNAAQNELDRVNTELGFLHPHSEREDFGKITHEGRYRVWKEIWTLNYLGRSAKYH